MGAGVDISTYFKFLKQVEFGKNTILRLLDDIHRLFRVNMVYYRITKCM
jgi:hypothetical protein